MITVSFDSAVESLVSVFGRAGVPDDKALLCGRIIAESAFDGVLSHSIAAVPRVVGQLRSGKIDASADPERIGGSGAIEQWNGHSGIGIVNATGCTNRAMELAASHGLGCVGLKNTSHWLRAGSYGWQAVREGYALVCWTNTQPNMPAWGATELSVGNNPLVIAVPHPETPVVLDIAMSQFALGRLALSSASGVELPVPGGYDAAGALTTDPAAIVESRRYLPMGFWKGSGLAMLLDLLAVLLSGGNSTQDYVRMGGEKDVSQVFLAFDPRKAGTAELLRRVIPETIEAMHAANPVNTDEPVKYPGEGAASRRRRHMEQGLPLDEALWAEILSLAKGDDAT